MIELEAQVLADGHLRISDSGDSIGYLHVNGLSLTRSAIDEVRRLCRKYNVMFDNYELTAEADEESLRGLQIHSVIQAALAVTDMIQKRRPHDLLRFEEMVETFLAGNRAVYDSDFHVEGQDLQHVVRFHVDSARKLLIQPLSPANETAAYSWAERWAYRFDDIRRRDSSWRPFAVLDDRGDRREVWSHRTLVPLRRDATVVFWSENGPLSEALAGRAV